MRTRLVRARPARFGAVILTAGGVALLGACSSGTGTSGGSASPKSTSPTMTQSASPSTSMSVSAATCKHVASLRASLESLSHVQLNASASAQIRKDLTNIQTQIAAIKASGNATLSTQVNALSSSVNQVTKAASNLSSPPTAAQVQKMITALSGVKASSKTAIAQLQMACPNA